MQGSHYTDEQRRQAVVASHIYGSMERTSEAVGIPRTTLIDWRNQDWWEHWSVELRQEIREEIAARTLVMVRKSLNQVEDRLDNGDTHVMRDGSVVRVPIKARDAAVTFAIMFDKRQLMLNQPTTISERRSIDATAGEMIAAFRAATCKDVEGQVIERTVADGGADGGSMAVTTQAPDTSAP